MSGTNFRLYDPVADLIATGGGGGGVPSTGGTFTGPVVIQSPSKISQCAPPTGPCDLANKAYVDSLIGGGPFLPLAGGTMNGAISQPIAPSAANDLTNKAYVDAQVAAGVPDATTSVKGKIQLAGDLGGTGTTAASPIISNLAITNTKLANLSGPNKLKGSSSSSSAATDISLTSNLIMTGTTLDVNTSALSGTFLPLAGGTMSGAISQPIAPSAANDLTNKAYVDAQVAAGDPDATTTTKGKIQLAGDLGGPGTTAASPVISNLAITTAKLADANVTNIKLALGPNLTLKGTNSSGVITDLTVDSNLTITATQLQVNTTSLASSLPKAGATQFGMIEFDSTGDLNATSANSGIGVVKPLAITNAKMANMSGTSELKGSGSGSNAVVNLTVGNGLIMTTNQLQVDTTTLPVIPVSKGGTGATTLTGYLKGNGTSPITSVSSIPVADVVGAVGSVNGVFPTPTNGGNVTVLMGNVTTGVLSGLPAQPQPNGNIYVVSGDPTPANNGRTFISDGTTWNEVTANQASTDARYVLKAGDTMIGPLIMQAPNKVTLNYTPTASTDAANKAYVDSQISGGSTPDATTTVKGKIKLAGDFDPTSTADIPIIVSATSSVPGKIQLAGDLTGSSTVPVVAPLAISNSKLANLSGISKLKGSSSSSSAATDISLSSNLMITGTTLDVNTSALSGTFLPLAGGTMSGAISQPIAPSAANDLTNKAYVDAQVAAGAPDATTTTKGKIQLAGDLGGPGTTAASPVISNLAITTAKLADANVTNIKLALGPNLTLKGTNSSGVITDLTVDSNLTITATQLQVNTAGIAVSLPKATSTVFGTIEFPAGAAGLANGDLDKATPDGVAVVKTDAITTAKILNSNVTNLKLAPGPNITLKGTDTSSTVNDISLGSSMSMTNTNQLNSSVSFFNGTDPNSTAPTDRPQTNGVLYYGNNGSTWIWNGTMSVYVSNGSNVVSNTVTGSGTVNAGLAQFGVDGTTGKLTLSFASGANRTVLTHASETTSIGSGAPPQTIQAGGTFGAIQSIGTTTTIIGLASQRNKVNPGDGAMFGVYNSTDNIFYDVHYHLTANSPRTAYINVRY